MDMIWIELVHPLNDEYQKKKKKRNDLIPEEIKAIGDARAEKATKILRKLGDNVSKFMWYPKECRYVIVIDEAGCFMECADHGHWFNLDYLSK